jgi:integrase
MVTHSKERALSEREFELLLEGARRIEKTRQSREAVFAILATGRLGMRAGEVIHLVEEWVNWRSRRVEIPKQMDCHLGRGDGPCGYCEQAARQMVEYYDPDEGLSRARARMVNRQLDRKWSNGDDLGLEDALELRWFAKTDAAEREIPFSWDARTELAFERFFERGRGGWNLSKTALNRRINKALRHADELDEASTMPHGLRSTAATYHAGRGLSTLALQSMFGWADMQTAQRYIKDSPDNTERALHQIHSI